MKSAMKTMANWTVPPAFQQIILAQWTRHFLSHEIRAVLASNRIFYNAHVGERCFILGTGPSTNTQDLTPLRHEVCISLNTFYLHKDYRAINPVYHLVSGLAAHPLVSEELGLGYFREIEGKVTADVIFHNYLDRQFILEHGLFKTCRVHYLHFCSSWGSLFRNNIDATKALYPGQSVSVMAVQVALYMGFKEIYLLGLDHDWILRYAERLPTHFYKPKDSVLERSGLTDWDKTDWEEQFYANWNLWHQYKLLGRFAEARAVHIYYATPGGLLDVFPRVDYNCLFE